MNRRLPAKRGFTLVEVVIGMAIALPGAGASARRRNASIAVVGL